MNAQPFPIRFKLTHPGDQSLQTKLEWFLHQPGIILAAVEPLQGGAVSELHISRKGVILLSGEERLRFHPSMALLRLMNLERGQADRFLGATGLTPGDAFLDATLGLGTDALVAAFAVGPQGSVVGIEQAAILAALVKDGLATLGARHDVVGVSAAKAKAWVGLFEAAPRIQVCWEEHGEFLKNLGDQTFDVVYFDPMFRRTRTKSASIRPLHAYAEHGELTRATIAAACRVARKRVVLKERKGSREFARLGFEVVESGRYSQVDYGVIELD